MSKESKEKPLTIRDARELAQGEREPTPEERATLEKMQTDFDRIRAATLAALELDSVADFAEVLDAADAYQTASPAPEGMTQEDRAERDSQVFFVALSLFHSGRVLELARILERIESPEPDAEALAILEDAKKRQIRAALFEWPTMEDGDSQGERPHGIRARHIPREALAAVVLPLDKANARGFEYGGQLFGEYVKLDNRGQIPGQLNLFFNVTGHKDKRARPSKKRPAAPAVVTLAVDFSDLPGAAPSRRLEPLDGRYQNAIGALCDSVGPDSSGWIFSPGQIWQAMGGRGRPNTAQRKKIMDRVARCAGIKITINNEAEAARYSNVPRLSYSGYLVAAEWIEAEDDAGQAVHYVHILQYPPMIKYARGRGQITTISRDFIEAPLSLTDANAALVDFFARHIKAIEHNKKLSHKVEFATLYKRHGITDRKEQQRTRDRVAALLDYYTQKGIITAYSQDAEAVTIQPREMQGGNG